MQNHEPIKLDKDNVLGVSAVRYKISLFCVSYENASWKYVLLSMLGYALQPIALPVMILASKLLKRKIEWFPVWNK